MRHHWIIWPICLLLVACGEEMPGTIIGTTILPNPLVVFNGDLDGVPYVVVGSKSQDFYTGFANHLDGGTIDLSVAEGLLPRDLLQDGTGTVYDLYGVGRGGGNDGAVLPPLPVGTSFWLTAAGMDPGIPLNGNPRLATTGFIPQADPAYSIPINSLFTGSGFGVINTLEEPAFVEISQRRDDQAGYLLDSDGIVAVAINGEERIYPLPILTAFEIVNDVVGGVPIAVTYSPLSNSARVWRRPSLETDLGVTGMLTNSTMLMFDKSNTANRYHHLTGWCVSGPDRGSHLEPVAYVRTSWKRWKRISLISNVLVPPPSINLATIRRMNARIRNDEPHRYPVDYSDGRRAEKQMILSVFNKNGGAAYGLEVFEP